MDQAIAAAAQALAAGDSLAALREVALRDDAPALALRGIAMAQLGEYSHARELLRRAARGFGSGAPLARARCTVAAAEVALALRDLGGAPRTLLAAADTLAAHGDLANALLARLVVVRRWLLLGRLGEASAGLDALMHSALPARLAAVAALLRAELALRALAMDTARAALTVARAAAARADIPALRAEVAALDARARQPAARRVTRGTHVDMRLDEVATLLASGALVVDACRRGVRGAGRWLPLARRPVLFTLAQALAAQWPAEVEREALIASAFRNLRPDETHRARLRVELGRLRRLLAPLAHIEATARGYRLVATRADPVVLLLPPIAGERAALLALLADGAAWSTSALAVALGESQRTVQRALVELEAEGRVRASGRARTQRWLAPPLAGYTTLLLLPTALPTS